MALALNNLAIRHRPMLLCYATALLGGDENLAEDVVQESFLIAQRRFNDFRDDGDFGGWLRGIARNKVSELRRAAASQPMLVDSRVIEGIDEMFLLFDSVAPENPEEETWRQRLSRLLNHCIDKLPAAVRLAIVEVYANGRSLREAAEALAATPAAVAQRVSRGRELIRACVEAHRREEA